MRRAVIVVALVGGSISRIQEAQHVRTRYGRASSGPGAAGSDAAITAPAPIKPTPTSVDWNPWSDTRAQATIETLRNSPKPLPPPALASLPAATPSASLGSASAASAPFPASAPSVAAGAPGGGKEGAAVLLALEAKGSVSVLIPHVMFVLHFP
jgi:hypothetical protein